MMHIWLGNFESEKEFKKYMDQREYLEAWAVYDNEPPTGNEEEDAEPSPELRCDFCKEVDLETYDEDLMIMKYYRNSVEISAVAEDILTDEEELRNRCEKQKINNVNAAIAYEDDDLNEADAANSTKVQYVGKIPRILTAGSVGVHYLWVGADNIENEDIVEKINVEENEIIDINFYYNNKKEKLDEMIITQVEDFNIAEKMILKIDEMKIPMEAKAMLDVFLNEDSEINGEKIGTELRMRYIGRFEVE